MPKPPHVNKRLKAMKLVKGLFIDEKVDNVDMACLLVLTLVTSGSIAFWLQCGQYVGCMV